MITLEGRPTLEFLFLRPIVSRRLMDIHCVVGSAELELKDPGVVHFPSHVPSGSVSEGEVAGRMASGSDLNLHHQKIMSSGAER